MNDEYFKTLNHCILCNNKNIKDLYTSHDMHYAIKGDYKYGKCMNCGLVFLNPMPSEFFLTSLYPETYYSYNDFYEKPLSFFKKIYKNFLVKIRTLDPIFKTPGKILDIGCGSGQFLYKMKKKGWQTFGVDVNKNACKLGNELENLNIFPGDLLNANFRSNFFDYIRSNHSFEHIANPHEILDEIKRILRDDGKLLIGVPNIDSFNGRFFKKYWWHLGAPVHTFNYSVSTLTKMLELHGFIVEKLNYNGDYGGTIGSLQIFLNRNDNSEVYDKGILMNSFFKVLGQCIAKIQNVFNTGDVIEIICHKNV